MVYYKGEDITLTMTLFEDEKCEKPIAADDHHIDVVLYSTMENAIIHASTQSGAATPVEVVASNVMKITVGRNDIELLPAGQIMIEMRLTSKANDKAKIVQEFIFSLVDTRVKNL